MKTDLLAKYFAGECSETEKKDVENWAGKNQETARQFSELEKIWKTRGTGDLVFPDTDNAWKKVKGRILPASRFGLIYKIAAALVLGIGLSWAGYQIFNQPDPGYQTRYTEAKKAIILPDSSEVWLKENSELILSDNFISQARKVELKGEAYFTVRKRPGHPFTVQAGQTEITVLGTTFLVSANPGDNEISVSVETGRVSFSSGENRTLLLPGFTGIFRHADQTISSMETRNPNILSWKTGVFTFKNEQLLLVLESLQRFYPARFTLSDSSFGRLKLTAHFDNLPEEQVIEIVSRTLNLRFTKQSGNYLVTRP